MNFADKLWREVCASRWTKIVMIQVTAYGIGWVKIAKMHLQNVKKKKYNKEINAKKLLLDDIGTT